MKHLTLRDVRNYFVKWFFFNLFTFPALMAFYIPYQLFWIQLTPLQLLKYIGTAGFFAAIVNFALRPLYAWVTRFNDKHFGEKVLKVSGPTEEGVFAVERVEDSKK